MSISCIMTRTKPTLMTLGGGEITEYLHRSQIMNSQVNLLWKHYRRKDYAKVRSLGELLIKEHRLGDNNNDESNISMILRSCLKLRDLTTCERIYRDIYKDESVSNRFVIKDSIRGTMMEYASLTGDPVLGLGLLKETLQWRIRNGYAISATLFNYILEAYLVKYKRSIQEGRSGDGNDLASSSSGSTSNGSYLEQGLEISKLMNILQVNPMAKTHQLIMEFKILKGIMDWRGIQEFLTTNTDHEDDITKQDRFGVLLSSYVFLGQIDMAELVYEEFLSRLQNRLIIIPTTRLSSTLRKGVSNFLRSIASSGDLEQFWNLTNRFISASSDSLYLLSDSEFIESILAINHMAMKEIARKHGLEGSLNKDGSQILATYRKTWFHLLTHAIKMGLILTGEIYNAILASYSFCIRTFPSEFTIDDIQPILHDMNEQGVVPSLTTCHLLIELYGGLSHEDRLGQGLKIYEKLKLLGWKPTAITFSLLYTLCLPSETRFLHRYSTKIDRRILDLEEERKRLTIQHDIVSATSLIKVLGRGRRFDEMVGVMAEVDRLRLPKDCMYYNAIFNAWMNAYHISHLGTIKSIWSSMIDEDHLQPTIYTVNKYVHSLATLGDFSSIEYCMEHELSRFSLQPDILTWNALMKAYLRHNQLEKVEALLMNDHQHHHPPSPILEGPTNPSRIRLPFGLPPPSPPNSATFYQLLNYLSNPHPTSDPPHNLAITRLNKVLFYYQRAIQSVRGSCQNKDPLLFHYLIKAYLNAGELEIAYELVSTRKPNEVLAGTYRHLIIALRNRLNYSKTLRTTISQHNPRYYNHQQQHPIRSSSSSDQQMRITLMIERLKSLSGTPDIKWLNRWRENPNNDDEISAPLFDVQRQQQE